MGRRPETTDFLKACIADALVRLLQQKPLAKITISELIERAGVGRMTYFRYFKSKEDVLAYKLVHLWEQWAEDRQLLIRRNFSLDNSLEFFEFNYHIRNLLLLFYERNLQPIVYEAFYRIMVEQNDDDLIEVYAQRFYSYGLFGILDGWIERGFHDSPEHMAEILTKVAG